MTTLPTRYHNYGTGIIFRASSHGHVFSPSDDFKICGKSAPSLPLYGFYLGDILQKCLQSYKMFNIKSNSHQAPYVLQAYLPNIPSNINPSLLAGILIGCHSSRHWVYPMLSYRTETIGCQFH